MSLVIFDYNDKRLYAPIDRIFGIEKAEWELIKLSAKNAWDRCLYCFKNINNPKFQTGGVQPYHSIQYGMFLYFLSNEIYKKYISINKAVAETICDKIFMVNMSITGMDIYYGGGMSDIFLPTHTSGIVFSPHAKFGNYFMFAHGCNVGMNRHKAPVIDDYVIMYGNSKVVGNSHIGSYVVLGANTYIKDMDIPSHSLVFGQYPNVIIKEDHNNKAEQILKERFCL